MSSSSQDRPIAHYTNFKMKVKDDNFDHRPKNLDEVDDLQWTADQEILLLYSLHGYKPVGKFLDFGLSQLVTAITSLILGAFV